VIAANTEKKALIATLGEEVESLSRDLRRLQFIAPAVAYAGETPDEDPEKLREELEWLREECPRRTREAEALAMAAKQELQSLIASATVRFERQIETVRGEIEEREETDRAEFEKVRKSLSERSEAARNAEAEIAKSHTNEKNERIQVSQQSLAELYHAHFDLEAQVRADREGFSELASNSRVVLTAALSTLTKNYETELRQFDKRARHSDSELADRVVAADQARNSVRDLFASHPSRPEEHTAIQRLGQHLSFKSQQLTTLGKDLLSYRQRLTAQEGEYNGRFGVDPKVAVMRSGMGRSRAISTLIPKRLPGLSEPV
jgi:hypothetical protein